MPTSQQHWVNDDTDCENEEWKTWRHSPIEEWLGGQQGQSLLGDVERMARCFEDEASDLEEVSRLSNIFISYNRSDKYFVELWQHRAWLAPSSIDWGALWFDPTLGQIRKFVERLHQVEQELEQSQATLQVLRLSAERFLSPQDELECKFNTLAEQWQRETGHISISVERYLHPAYQRIIGMGKEALPLILNELKVRPDLWFWALRYITDEGEDPVSPGDDVKTAIEKWLQWGTQRGYIADGSKREDG